MLNVTYIISDINKSLAFEWIALHIDKTKFNLNFILINNNATELEAFLVQNNIRFERIGYKGARDLLTTVSKVRVFLKKNKTDVVHTHLVIANIIGLLGAKFAGIKKRIYTRHHSNYHLIYHPRAVKYDKITNWLATRIIAISNVVKEILIKKEQVPENKIRIVHHGFKLDDFSNVPSQSIKMLSHKYNPRGRHPVVGVISRQTEWKGIQYIVPAFKRLLADYPTALLILANAEGDYKKEITALLKELPVENYCEISFEADIFALYKLFDVFVHAPISGELEAFGQIYIEALAAEVPSVFTVSGIAHEFIRNRHNALTVPYRNTTALYTAMKEVIDNNALRNLLKKNGKMDVYSEFSLDKMMQSLEKLYAE